MNTKTRGLFDEELRLEKISKQDDPLEKLEAHINFEIFRKPLEEHFEKGKERSQGGRPPFDYVLMFKILIIQRYYNLSDDSTEYAILDRLSFMRFLRLSLADRVPDAKTIWNFKNELAKTDLVKKLFYLLDGELNKRRIILHKGKMVDATIVETPVQRNSREENEKLKRGEIPEEWENKPHKFRQKDTDAKWVKHNNNDYFGYKNHIKAERKTKLITGYAVTPANVHDSELIEKLLRPQDSQQPLHGDSAYRSEEIEKMLKRKKIKSFIHEFTLKRSQ